MGRLAVISRGRARLRRGGYHGGVPPERTDLMTDHDLDRSYSALCESLAIVGEQKSELFLSMVCLALMARYERAEDVLPLITNVQAQCAAEPEGH
jgi:hypothetical protein